MHYALILACLSLTLPLFAQGTIGTIAGNGNGVFTGDGGPATSASIQSPNALAVDAAGNVYISDFGNQRIRRIAPDGTITTYAGNGTIGFSGDGGPAVNAQLFGVITTHQGLALDSTGNLYIADPDNARIRKVTTAGIISTYAGKGPSLFGGDGGAATAAGLMLPVSVAMDGSDNLYISDQGNARIRKVTAAGVISTVAGTGTPAYSGDGGPATSAGIASPVSVASDAAGNFYFTDLSSHRIRKVDTSGTVTTFAGSGTPGFSGDNGPATSASILNPKGMCLDAVGNLYFADSSNNRIRKVDTNGIITTVAGSDIPGFAGDGGPATSARLFSPRDVKVDALGNLYIADSGNHRIRKVTVANSTTAPTITRVGNGAGNLAAITANAWVEIKGANLSRSTRIWSGSDFVNGVMPIQLDGVSVMIDNKPAFVYYVSPTQVNVLAHPAAIQGPVSVQVTTSTGTSAPFTAQAQAIAPAFFAFNGGSYLAATHADGSLLGPTTLFPGSTTPAKPGETIVLYGNGFGAIDSPITPGSPTQSGRLLTPPNISIGGRLAAVQFAGLVTPGLYQFNVVVPLLADDGDLMIRAGFTGSTFLTQANALLSVKR